MSWAAILVWSCTLLALAEPDLKASLQTAKEHVQKGRYAEAVEAYETLRKSLPQENTALATQWAAGLMAAHLAEGRLPEAEKVIADTLKQHPLQPRLIAHQAQLKLLRGAYQAALDLADQSLNQDDNEPLAHLQRGHALRELGQLKEADIEYRWCVRHYNNAQPKDAETLLILGEGASYYARWHSVSQIFNFLVNTLCPDALKADPQAWEAAFLSGELLIEKYNRGQGMPEYRAALAINPRAADVLAALGEAAFQQLDLKEAQSYVEKTLAVNPHHARGLHLKVDLQLRDGDFKAALVTLQTAIKVNPHDQRTLARQAFAFALQDGWPEGADLDVVVKHLAAISELKLPQPSRFQKVLINIAGINPHPGECLHLLGEQFERHFRFDLAERCYLAAGETMPQAPQPKASLGMLYMRVGRIDEAQKTLDKAFEVDPYHVRISNMRKVLKLLEEYRTIQTDNFVIRVDARQDRILGRYMAEYLEEIYPELTEKFGFEPPTRTQFEIFSKAKGVTGHQWFSARMVGLQWIQTIGASTGWIVALTSPQADAQQFNWANVLKHEFVHVITLQQTHFNCPHWFTEALATLSEGTPRPQVWTELLLERVPAGKLMTLDNINLGFQRPETPLDWQMAYCQSQMYARYMTQQHGPDALKKLLDAYRRGLQTPAAIKEVCGVDIPTFEAGYKAYLEQLVAGWKAFSEPELPDLATLEEQHQAQPQDAAISGKLAYASVMRRKFEEGRAFADESQKSSPKDPYAAVALAEIALLTKDYPVAIKHLEQVHSAENPHPLVLRRLAQAKLQSRDFPGAAVLFQLGTEKDPDNKAWWQGLAACYLGVDEQEKLTPVLEHLAELDYDSPGPRLKLAQQALARGDYAQTIRSARQVLYISVMDAEAHALLAQGYAGLNQWDRALTEWVITHAVDQEQEDALAAFEKLPEEIPADQRASVYKVASELAREFDDLPAVKTLAEALTD